MTTYKVTWTEVSQHEVELSAEKLAELLGVSVEEVEEDYEQALFDGYSLADELAVLEDDGFQWLERQNIEVEEV